MPRSNNNNEIKQSRFITELETLGIHYSTTKTNKKTSYEENDDEEKLRNKNKRTNEQTKK